MLGPKWLEMNDEVSWFFRFLLFSWKEETSENQGSDVLQRNLDLGTANKPPSARCHTSDFAGGLVTSPSKRSFYVKENEASNPEIQPEKSLRPSR